MIVKKQLLNKQFLIKQIQTMLPDTQIITHPNSLSCGLIFHSLKNGALPKNIEEKYWLYARKFSIQFHATLPTKVKIYKCFFLPHVTKKVIEQFLADLKKNIAPVSQ